MHEHGDNFLYLYILYIVLEFHIMHKVCFLVNPMPIPSLSRPAYPPPFFSCNLGIVLKPRVHLMFPGCDKHRATSWPTGHLAGAARLMRTGSPANSSHQLPIVPQLGWDCVSPSSINAGILASLVICRS